MIILILFVLGGVWFKMAAPVRCPPLAADAKIFVLTGDARRIPFATAKLSGFSDRRLYIIGVGTHNFSQYINDEVQRQVTNEYDSKSTAENAIAIKNIVNAEKFRKIVLVTTADHMMRAMVLVGRQLPDAAIVACPVPLNGTPVTRRLQRWGIEYVKYLGTIIGIEKRK
ncbi:MAG: YdcF family protein [Proteobacteria bacterium]|nr:YdcF family protein [Pseudomonadota bacterium]